MSELKQEKTQEHKVSDLNPEDKKITNPLELVKMDFSEYLSKLSKDIPSKVSLGITILQFTPLKCTNISSFDKFLTVCLRNFLPLVVLFNALIPDSSQQSYWVCFE